MTPPAMTAAGRTARSHAAPGTRRRVERPPLRPRRVSGPAVGRAQPATDRQAGTLGMRVLLGVRSLPDHSLLDRIVRGRVWIPVLGILLAGIVATQVEVLRLNASMGQALRQSSTLAIRNQALRVSVAELSDQARIERLAARMGMVMPGPTTLSFVPGTASAASAVQDIHAPAPDQFVAQLPSPASSDSSGASGASSSSGVASGSGSSSSSTDTSGSAGSSSSSSGSSGSGTTDTSGSSGTSSSGSSSGG